MVGRKRSVGSVRTGASRLASPDNVTPAPSVSSARLPRIAISQNHLTRRTNSASRHCPVSHSPLVVPGRDRFPGASPRLRASSCKPHPPCPPCETSFRRNSRLLYGAIQKQGCASLSLVLINTSSDYPRG